MIRRRTMIGIAVAVGLVAVTGVLLIGAMCCADDAAIVHGRVLGASGVPVADAVVRVSFPLSSSGGGDREVTDVDGCFALFAMHSPRDRWVAVSVAHAGYTHWFRV